MAADKGKSRFALPEGLRRSAPKRRPMRVADAIKEEVAALLVRKIKDPRLAGVSVTRVEVSDDLGHARIFYSLLGDETPESVAKGLASAAGFIRSSLARTLDLRHVPALDFRQDLAALRQEEMERLLRQIKEEDDSPL
jgi:ribosome-binding factor A